MYRSQLIFNVAVMTVLFACGGSEKRVESVADEGEELDQDDEAPTRHRASTPGMDDDDDDDGMEIEGLKGHLDPYDIETGVAKRSQALADCFHERARKEFYLGGEVELSFTVARDGSVKTVRPSRSSVGSWAVENCLLEVGMSMKFKKPKGGEADFSLPLDFDARRAANWWSEEKAEAEVAGRPSELRACAQEADAPDPQNVWVTLYLGNRGVVKSVGFASPHEDGIDPAWATCASAKVGAWTLNDPRGKVAKLGFRYNPQ